jgi:H(+)-translocating pyrophosphatase
MKSGLLELVVASLSMVTAATAQNTTEPTPASQYPYVAAGSGSHVVILGGVALGLFFAVFLAWTTNKIKIGRQGGPSSRLLEEGVQNESADVDERVEQIAGLITRGAESFLGQEFRYMGVFVVLFSILLFVVLGAVPRKTVQHPDGQADWAAAGLTVLAFITGAITSIVCGYLGMKIAVFANSRTAMEARKGYGPAFNAAFRAGGVMGFSLVALGLLFLYIILFILKAKWSNTFSADANDASFEDTRTMFEAVAGYGLGGSSIALFGRVGGGIYTKAADVGADLVGKVENNLPEDDPRNPAVIADNVGDNVGDIAGMGSDLFGSFAESSCAAMVIASQSVSLFNDWNAMVLPLAITGCGIFVCFLTSFVATHIKPVRCQADIETALKTQIIVSTVLMTPVAYGLCDQLLPETFDASSATGIKNYEIFICIAFGLWSGLIIGLITEYFTSHSYTPVKEVAEACKTGAATNIIYGLALGYKSVIIPTFCLAVTVYGSYSFAAMYGISMAALGILSTLSTGLTIDAYGPICDNAGGIAEMSGMDEEVRERTDALDAAGNTTAAIGKGFAIGSAALVSLALFGAFVTTCFTNPNGAEQQGLVVNVLEPLVFAGLLIGAMLPYWFSAMTMKSVGMAALEMVNEVRRQVREQPGILLGEVAPDYDSCIAISTAASLKEMIPPGALVMCSPIIMGFLFGSQALAGLLVGALVSGVQMAISASNTGGAWDNAKKFIEGKGLGEENGKGSAVHEAAVIGDTVGDPLKDTSGPALNILIKLMAIISVVFAPALVAVCGIPGDCSFPGAPDNCKNGDGLLIQLFK